MIVRVNIEAKKTSRAGAKRFNKIKAQHTKSKQRNCQHWVKKKIKNKKKEEILTQTLDQENNTGCSENATICMQTTTKTLVNTVASIHKVGQVNKTEQESGGGKDV